jgi:divalent metal cation (Fe/Co/Zn/Cd) transporter
MGETESRKTLKEVIRMAEGDDAIVKVIKHFSMRMSPDEVVLQLIATFKEGLDTKEITDAIERVEKNIRKRFPRMKQIFIEPRAARGR